MSPKVTSSQIHELWDANEEDMGTQAAYLVSCEILGIDPDEGYEIMALDDEEDPDEPIDIQVFEDPNTEEIIVYENGQKVVYTEEGEENEKT